VASYLPYRAFESSNLAQRQQFPASFQQCSLQIKEETMMSERAKQMITLTPPLPGAPAAFGAFSPGDSNTGEISGGFQRCIIIPDYAAIWAPITSGFLAFAIFFRALPSQRLNPRFMRCAMARGSALLNAAWIAAFNNHCSVSHSLSLWRCLLRRWIHRC